MVFDFDFNSDDSSPPTPRHGISTASVPFLFLFLLFVALPLAASQNTNLDAVGSSDPFARFNPSMAIIIVILVAAFFFMVFFSVYLRHCSDTTIRPMAVQSAARGIDSSVLQTFPTFAYSEVKDLKGPLECAVCLSEFQDHETLRFIPKCNHVFHPHCIDAWLASHTTCPVCRAHLMPDQPEDRDRIQLQVMMLNRNRASGSRSGMPNKFPKSHSTGHSSLVQPGEDTERFTLRLPVEVRRQIMANRALNRATSMVALPREGAWERNSMRYRRLDESLGEVVKSERWVFTMAPPFLIRESSMNSPKSADLGTRKMPSFIARVLSVKLATQQEAETSSALCPVIDKSQMTDSGIPPA